MGYPENSHNMVSKWWFWNIKLLLNK
jgi:hypothetical protein